MFGGASDYLVAGPLGIFDHLGTPRIEMLVEFPGRIPWPATTIHNPMYRPGHILPSMEVIGPLIVGI